MPRLVWSKSLMICLQNSESFSVNTFVVPVVVAADVVDDVVVLGPNVSV